MDRMKVYSSSPPGWAFQSPSPAAGKMALITRTDDQQQKGQIGWSSGLPPAPAAAGSPRSARCSPGFSVSMVLVIMSPPPLSTWNNGSIKKQKGKAEALPF